MSINTSKESGQCLVNVKNVKLLPIYIKMQENGGRSRCGILKKRRAHHWSEQDLGTACIWIKEFILTKKWTLKIDLYSAVQNASFIIRQLEQWFGTLIFQNLYTMLFVVRDVTWYYIHNNNKTIATLLIMFGICSMVGFNCIK